jgi:hypothetical protein
MELKLSLIRRIQTKIILICNIIKGEGVMYRMKISGKEIHIETTTSYCGICESIIL